MTIQSGVISGYMCPQYRADMPGLDKDHMADET